MALRNIFNSQRNTLTQEHLDITNQLVLKEENYEIAHTLNPDNGEYTVSNKNNVNLLKFNRNGVLQSSKVKDYIDTQNAPLFTISNSHSASLEDHETRLSSVENGEAGNQNLSSVLDVGNDADGNSITNLNNVSVQSINFTNPESDDLTLTYGGNELYCNKTISCDVSLYAPEVNCLGIGVNGVLNVFNSENSNIIMQSNAQENRIFSSSNASLQGFIVGNHLTGTSTNSNAVLVSGIDVPNNKMGYIKGKAFSKSSLFEFEVFCKNVDGVVSIMNWNLDSLYIEGNERITFNPHGQTVLPRLYNTNSPTNWSFLYETNFISV